MLSADAGRRGSMSRPTCAKKAPALRSIAFQSTEKRRRPRGMIPTNRFSTTESVAISVGSCGTR
jgi:hypothetical protein